MSTDIQYFLLFVLNTRIIQFWLTLLTIGARHTNVCLLRMCACLTICDLFMKHPVRKYLGMYVHTYVTRMYIGTIHSYERT